MDLRPMPPALVEAALRGGRQEWLATLSSTIEELGRLWSLVVGAPFQPGGQTAWVAPARDARGNELVLKVAWRHWEAAHEADGLRQWDGAGAVRLHAHEDLHDTVALLLERCRPGQPLASRPEPEQDVIVSGLLRQLWRAPSPESFRPLQVMCEAWADEFEAKSGSSRTKLDPGLAREGIGLFRTLPTTADEHVLLCTDLHAENVLSAERAPWLVIDPKPHVGDPTYDALQHMLNCPHRLRADPRALARRMAELLRLDPERLLLWLFARCVQESADRPELARVARCIAPG